MNGFKTYVLAAVGVGVLFADIMGYVDVDPEVYGLLGFAALAAVRHGISTTSRKSPL